MAKLPDISQDISLLKRFIRAVEDLPTAPSTALEVAQNHAEILLKRLETPVRIAVTGATGAGKSSLVNLLLGEPLAPMGERRIMPPVLFEHSDVDKTTVGWWDRPSKQTAGHLIKAALKEEPDLISVGVDSPILKTLQLIDVSGLDQPGHDKDAVLALTQLADVLIWCSTITEKLDDAQTKLVRMLPKRLTKNSLMVLTHADDLTPEACEAAAAEVERGNGRDFLYVSYIATPHAWAAFHGEGNDPETMWEQSGAPQVLADLTEIAVKTRAKEVAKIQRSIARQVIPYTSDVPMPPEEEELAAPEVVEEIATEAADTAPVEPVVAEPEPVVEPEPVPAPEPEPEPEPETVKRRFTAPKIGGAAKVVTPEPELETAAPEPEPEAVEPVPQASPEVDEDTSADEPAVVKPLRVKRDPPEFPLKPGAALYASWQEKLRELSDNIASEEIASDSDFVQAAQELVSDFLDELVDVDTIPDDHDWLVADFEKANDLMILLQFESGDRTAVDAAHIVAQLTDSLSYV